jgi:hypothetical protein
MDRSIRSTRITRPENLLHSRETSAGVETSGVVLTEHGYVKVYSMAGTDPWAVLQFALSGRLYTRRLRGGYSARHLASESRLFSEECLSLAQ